MVFLSKHFTWLTFFGLVRLTLTLWPHVIYGDCGAHVENHLIMLWLNSPTNLAQLLKAASATVAKPAENITITFWLFGFSISPLGHRISGRLSHFYVTYMSRLSHRGLSSTVHCLSIRPYVCHIFCISLLLGTPVTFIKSYFIAATISYICVVLHMFCSYLPFHLSTAALPAVKAVITSKANKFPSRRWSVLDFKDERVRKEWRHFFVVTVYLHALMYKYTVCYEGLVFRFNSLFCKQTLLLLYSRCSIIFC